MMEKRQKSPYEVIVDYLEESYTEARAAEDIEIMIRLSRAILAFQIDTTDSAEDIFTERALEKYYYGEIIHPLSGSETCCETCHYHDEYSWVCCNPNSPRRGGFTSDASVCGDWAERVNY